MNLNEVPNPHIYTLDDSGIVVKKFKDKNGNYIERRVSDPIWIEEIFENIDEKSITARIGFDYLGEERYIIAKREDFLNIQNIVKFQRQGLDVMHSNVKDVVLHLKNEEVRAYKSYKHSKLGFDTCNSKTIYKHYKCLGLESTYAGNYVIKPKGSRDAWLKMFQEEIQGHTPLELICILSLSAVLIGYIGEDIGLDNIVCHLTGNSTTGKSTAMKLAISMFGYPDVKETGLFSSYNSTGNALIKSLDGIKGVPIAFDEVSMANSKDLDNLVYKLANGVDKNRLNKNSELREKARWLSTIFSNGEEPIIKALSNTGLFNRVFEFENVVWTKDAINAERITSTILKNYGHIGVEFAQFVMKEGKKQVWKIYKQSVRTIKQLFTNHNIKDAFTDRRINRHAIFLATAILFEKAFKIKLSNEKIMDLLMTVEKSSIENRNFDKTSIEYICNFISINIGKFNVYSKPHSLMEPIYAKHDYWGNIIISEGKTEIEINPLILEEYLKKGGFKSTKVVLKELRDKGYLDYEKDKLYRKRKNNLGKLSKIYVLVIKNEDEDSSFDSINTLLENITDVKKRKLLMLEKQRMKQVSLEKKKA